MKASSGILPLAADYRSAKSADYRSAKSNEPLAAAPESGSNRPEVTKVRKKSWQRRSLLNGKIR